MDDTQRSSFAAPADTGQAWYYMRERHMLGPCSLDELQQSLNAGIITLDTQVWSPGMKEWTVAGAVLDASAVDHPDITFDTGALDVEAFEGEVSFGDDESEDPDDDSGGDIGGAGFESALLTPIPATAAHLASAAAARPAAPVTAEDAFAAAFQRASATLAQGDTEPHPWRRWFARIVDMTVAGFVIGVFIGLFAPDNTILDSTLAGTMLVLLLWMVAEPFVLTHFENTPGKALLNIQLRTAEGRSLRLDQAFQRAARVWFFGMAAGFPLVSLFTMANAYTKLNREGTTSWDRAGGFVVTHGEIGTGRVVGITLFILFYVLVSVVGALV